MQPIMYMHVEDWAHGEAGVMRSMAVHTLLLARRSSGSKLLCINYGSHIPWDSYGQKCVYIDINIFRPLGIYYIYIYYYILIKY